MPYGKDDEIILEVPDEKVYFVVDRGVAPAIEDVGSQVKRSLRKPMGSPPLQKMVDSGSRVLIVGDDNTRPTPLDIILPALLDELNASGVPDENVEALIALGTHRSMTKREIQEKFGEEVVERIPVMNHDYKDYDNLINVGKTRSGIPIVVNKKVFQADLVIGVGNIVPHSIAEWGGGGKIIQPGVCGEETTTQTHVMGRTMRRSGEFVGKIRKRIRREMDEIAVKANLGMIINTVLNEKDEVAHIFTGDPIRAFRRGVKTARELYCPKVPGLADIVVVSSYPSDIDYWQAGKPLEYAVEVVKPGGTIILITPCPEGISPAHPIFRERAKLSFEENLKAIEEREVDDLLALSAVLALKRAMRRADVICYSDGLTAKDMEALGFKQASSVGEAIEMAFERQGKDARIGILKCGEILPIVG
ncbi:MAG: nickel-dependent lactate racemase [Candidatus Geothermarchaeales archaeon]